MPVVESAIVARLVGSTTVTALAGTRIYPTMPQEPKLPAVTYDLVSAVRESAMTADPGTVHARVQVTSWAQSYSAASGLCEAVRGATQRWSGTSTGVVVLEMFVINEYTSFDDESGTFAHSLDLQVHYEE